MVRNLIKTLVLAMSVAFIGSASATTFNLFSPSNGVLKGNSSTYITTSAVSSDIIILWTSTCNTTTFLRADGICQQINLTTNVTGTLPVANGGSGATTLTGPLKGNGTSAFSAALASDIIGLFSGCSGVLSLGADGACHNGTPGGSNTQVQFNDSSAFGGDSGLTYNKTTDTLTAVNYIGTSLNVTTVSQNGNQVLDTGQNAQTVFFSSDSVGNGLSLVNGSTGTAATNTLDVANLSNTLHMMIAGTGHTGTLVTGGVSGESAAVYTQGAVSMDIGTNSISQMRLTSGGGVQVGGPTGGDKGAGTVNATGLYVNGTAVLSGAGGSTTQIQFNSSGTLTGDSGLVYNSTTNTVTLGDTSTFGTITAPDNGAGAGADITIKGGDSTTGNGSDVFITAGTRTGTTTTASTRGRVIITGGAGGTTGGAGGPVNLTGGAPSVGNNGAGGGISLTGANGDGSGTGGIIQLQAGSGNPSTGTGNGANIALTAGNGGAVSGNGGNVTLQAGSVTSGTPGSVQFIMTSPSTGTHNLYLGGAGDWTIGVTPGNAGETILSGGAGSAVAWGQLNLTTGVTGVLPVANGGSGAARSTFTATISAGCTTTPTFTAEWTKVGDIVALYFPTTSCTANANGLTVSGVPSTIAPPHDEKVSVYYTNTSIVVPASASICGAVSSICANNSGQILFNPLSGGSAVGSQGVVQITMTYGARQ